MHPHNVDGSKVRVEPAPVQSPRPRTFRPTRWGARVATGLLIGALAFGACSDDSPDPPQSQPGPSSEPASPAVRGVIPSAAGAPGTPLGNGFEVAAGTVLIGDPVENRLPGGSGAGQTVTEVWKATSLIQGGEPLAIIDDYLAQATNEGLVEQSRHGCDLDNQVTICWAYATTPAGTDPRVMAVTVLRGFRGDVLSDHVVVQHADGEADWLKSPNFASPGAADVPAAPEPGDWPLLAAEGEELGTAGELDRALVVMRGSRLAGPPRLTLEDATGGLEAVLEVTGDPEAVLQSYVDQFAEQGFDGFDLEPGTEIGGAVVTATGVSVAGGDYYSFTLVERPGRPTWIFVSGGHD